MVVVVVGGGGEKVHNSTVKSLTAYWMEVCRMNNLYIFIFKISLLLP